MVISSPIIPTIGRFGDTCAIHNSAESSFKDENDLGFYRFFLIRYLRNWRMKILRMKILVWHLPEAEMILAQR